MQWQDKFPYILLVLCISNSENINNILIVWILIDVPHFIHYTCKTDEPRNHPYSESDASIDNNIGNEFDRTIKGVNPRQEIYVSIC